MRYVFLFCLVLALGAAGSGVAMAAPTDGFFSVHALGLKVGELRLKARQDGSRYHAEARFATTGLVSVLRNMGFAMKSAGQEGRDRLWPDSYEEQVNTGNRVSSARMIYRDGTPELIGGAVEDGEAEPLDPAGETGTIDPLSAMYAVLRDQDAGNLCKSDQLIFDGARRTRVRLTGRKDKDGTVICSGHFIRVAGYPPKDLEKRRVVPLWITYAPGPEGRMQVQSARLNTDYGPVSLQRRD